MISKALSTGFIVVLCSYQFQLTLGVCNQAKLETAWGTSWSQPAASTNYIVANKQATIISFYDWQSNNGYCGETSFMSAAGMQAGTWMSQYNTRLVCGSGLSQSGVDGACAQNSQQPNYNAELLLEDPNTGI